MCKFSFFLCHLSFKSVLPNGIVATSKIVSSIFLSTDELLKVEELAVSSSPNFINDSGLQIYKNGTGNMLPSASLAKEGVECIITSYSLITVDYTISVAKVYPQMIQSKPRNEKKKLGKKKKRIGWCFLGCG